MSGNIPVPQAPQTMSSREGNSSLRREERKRLFHICEQLVAKAKPDLTDPVASMKAVFGEDVVD